MEKLKDYEEGRVFEGKIPKDQVHKMALLWGEGSPELTNLLEYCINNNIKTTASCRGHSEEPDTDAYILFGTMPKDFIEHMVSIVESEKNLPLRASISRFGDHKPKLDIHAKTCSKTVDSDSAYLFKMLLDGVQSYKEKDLGKPSEEKQEMIDKMYSNEGFGKGMSFFSDIKNIYIYDMPDNVAYVDKNGKAIIKYGYSPLRRFCMSSKKTLSQIIEKGKDFFSRAFKQQEKTNQDITKDEGGKNEYGE